ncbi:MAG: hypothetical protein N4A61_09070 [Pelagimonas sp.]|jgi:hypothetical protein|nr:hypothetical protein [Pelagimonas sp.]
MIRTFLFGLTSALIANTAQAQSLQSYQTCLQAYVNAVSYVGWIEGKGFADKKLQRAALDQDFEAFVGMGVARYGENRVRALIPEAQTDYINAIVTLHHTDGVLPTLDTVLETVAPCGGPQGALNAIYNP